MQAFHFSLEKVLDHRKTIEQEAKRAYAQKQQLLIQQEQHLNTLTQEKAQLFDVNEMTIGRMQVQQRYLLALNATIDEVQNKMFHVKQELAESLSVVVEAQQERKIVENCEKNNLLNTPMNSNWKSKNNWMSSAIAPYFLKALMVLVMRRPWFQSIS